MHKQKYGLKEFSIHWFGIEISKSYFPCKVVCLLAFRFAHIEIGIQQ